MTRAPKRGAALLALVVTGIALVALVALGPAAANPAAGATPALATPAVATPAVAAPAAATPAATPAAVPVAAPAEGPPAVTLLTSTVDGMERRWVLVAPSSGRYAVDLVIALHGVGTNGAQMRTFGLESLAIPAGVALAFPDAAYGAWNDGRPGADVLSPDGRGADDIAFLRTVISGSSLQMKRPVRSVGVIGFSNGAMMAARVACEMSDVVSVVAIVAGSAPEGFQSSCRPQHPVSVAIVAARGDPIVPYDGGQVAAWNGRPRGRVSGVEATAAFWARVDTCVAGQNPGSVVAAPPVGETETGRCAATRHVARYAMEDVVHDWRRGGGFDTTAIVWSFMRSELPRFADLDDLARAGVLLEPQT